MSRVLYVNDYPLSFGGGAEVIVGRTIGLLQAAGWETRLFSSADLPDARITARRYLNNPIARRGLEAVLAEYRPDIVHVHNYYHILSPGILSTIAEYRERHLLRVVMTAHDFHLVCPNAGGTWFPRRAGRVPIDTAKARNWSYLFSRRWDHRGMLHSWLRLAQHVWNYRWGRAASVPDVVISPSVFLEDLLRPLVHETRCIPHPAPRWKSLPTATRPGELTWLFVGRLEPEKGLGEFLQLLPPTFAGRIVVVGEGADRSRCEAMVAERGWANRVSFRGKIPHAEVANAIAAAQVLVSPSLVPESYGLVLAEALSLGTNVLATDLGGSREIIGVAKVGWLFRPGDAQDLASKVAAIESAFRDGSLNRFDASAFFAERSEEHYLRKILDVYEAS